jgi:transcriptional regulator with XRE-family HTH domain
VEIGNRIRKIRLQQGRTIQEVADACQCSKALLSKIENDKVIPAVATLSKIAKALGVKVSVLMETDVDGDVALIPNIEGNLEKFVPTSQGYGIFVCAPQVVNKKIQPMLIHAKKGEVKPHSVYHEGEEYIYVLEGEMKIHIANTEYLLKKGESVYFNSLNEHGILPVSDEVYYLNVFVE